MGNESIELSFLSIFTLITFFIFLFVNNEISFMFFYFLFVNIEIEIHIL